MIAHQAFKENDIVEINFHLTTIKPFHAKIEWIRYNKFLGLTIIDFIKLNGTRVESCEIQFVSKVIKSDSLVGINGNCR